MPPAYRLHRLFHPHSGRCIDVAVDHGFFGEPRFLVGIEDMEQVVRTLVAAGPDAIQLSVGLAPLLQSQPGRDKPALVLWADGDKIFPRDHGRQLAELLPQGRFKLVRDSRTFVSEDARP